MSPGFQSFIYKKNIVDYLTLGNFYSIDFDRYSPSRSNLGMYFSKRNTHNELIEALFSVRSAGINEKKFC
jgi:hypothetical protein